MVLYKCFFCYLLHQVDVSRRLCLLLQILILFRPLVDTIKYCLTWTEGSCPVILYTAFNANSCQVLYPITTTAEWAYIFTGFIIWRLCVDQVNKFKSRREHVTDWWWCSGLYWSKVHFNNRFWTQYAAWGADYDALLRQFVEVVLIGLVSTTDVSISEDCLMKGTSPQYTHAHTQLKIYKLIPNQFKLMLCLHWYRQQRDVASNQWDSRSSLFITVSSNSRQWDPCQVPGCWAIKRTYR